MSKLFIEFEKENDEFKNIQLREKSLFINRKYKIGKIDNLIEDIKNGKINIKNKKNKYIIDDINVIKKYSKIAKNIDKKNRTIKRTKFISLAVAGTLGTYIILNKNDDKPVDTNIPKVEENILDDKTNDIKQVINSSNNIADNITTEKIEKKEDISTAENIEEKSNITATGNNFINNNEFESEETSKQEIINNEDNTINEDIVYTFEAEDVSMYNNVAERYDIQDSINYYSECYGIDPNLITATICQENMNNEINNSDKGGYGLTQIESVHNGETVWAYNILTEEFDYETIDTERVKYDNDYAVKIAEMLYKFNFHYINNNYTFLNEKEKVLATIFCYNKGFGTITDSLDNYTDFDTFINEVKSKDLGDDDYIENVLRYLKNGTEITLIDDKNSSSSIIINNINANTIERTR